MRGWEHATPADVRDRRTRMPQVKRSKYGATPTMVDGIRFHSAKESRRYTELKLLEKAGAIRGLALQPSFSLHASQNPGVAGSSGLGLYRADFWYVDVQTGAVVIEDVKGVKTPLYRWKKKHVEAQYGITIREL